MKTLPHPFSSIGKAGGKPMSEQHRLDRPELREIIGTFTRNVIYTERQRNDGLLTPVEWSSQIFEHETWLKGKFLALIPDIEQIDAMLVEARRTAKREEGERITSIIKEYKLESTSVRDDMLELQAKGWKLLWQALKEKK